MKTVFRKITAVAVTSILFTLLFYHEQIGINLILFEFVSVLLLAWIYPFPLRNLWFRLTLLGLISSAFFVIFFHTAFAITMNLVSLAFFTTSVFWSSLKNPAWTFLLFFANVPLSVIRVFKVAAEKISRFRAGKIIIRVLKIAVFPLVVAIVFFVIYLIANPFFNNSVGGFLTRFEMFLTTFFKNINLELFFFYLFGAVVASALFIHAKYSGVLAKDSLFTNALIRKRRRITFQHKVMSLQTEYRSGILLLILLNAMIAFLNYLDIANVWLNFEWNGQFLKQFVHSGTWLLIFSIFISAGVALYFFRGNLNFYKKNKLLRILTQLWLAQNAFMTLSVAVRNYWYVYYYNLAYLRIGVFIFLILTIAGLFTVFIKISKCRSAGFVVRTNFLIIYAVLIFFSGFNWNRIIARYNIAHSSSAYFHLDYMVSLPNSVLPDLKENATLFLVPYVQTDDHPYSSRRISYHSDIKNYSQILEIRYKDFCKSWEAQSCLSWNYADQRAYNTLAR